jgi:hypothetical protein
VSIYSQRATSFANEADMMTSWKAHRLAYSSFAICALEMLIFVSAILLVRTQFDHPILRKKATGIAWLFGTPAAVLFAIAGLFRDSRRGVAVLALIVAFICGLFCTLQMFV